MRLEIPIVSRHRLVSNIIKHGNLVGDDIIHNDVKSYLKDKFNVLNIYDIVNPYLIRSAIIESGDKIDGAKHYLVLDESGYEWEDEYTDELAKEVQERLYSDLDDAPFEEDERQDIKGAADAILFKDFGYDEFFEHIELSVYHRVKSSSHKTTLRLFYRVFQVMFSDLFLKISTDDIDSDKLSIYLAHLIITYMSEWRLPDIIQYEYEVKVDMYEELKKSSASTYLINLHHDFDNADYTDDMKYTIAVIIFMGYLFVRGGFMKNNMGDKEI